MEKCLHCGAVRQQQPPSKEIDLRVAEEILGALAKRIENEPLSPAPLYVWVHRDGREAMQIRGLLSMARSNHDAFWSCLDALKRESAAGDLLAAIVKQVPRGLYLEVDDAHKFLGTE